MEGELKSMAKENVKFLGAVDNKNLSAIYQKMDVFVLPSKVEPWGLVVEEALNNGLPVIVSNRVGCAEEIVTDEIGLIFDLYDPLGLNSAIVRISEIDRYNKMREAVSRLNFEKIENRQIECYCD